MMQKSLNMQTPPLFEKSLVFAVTDSLSMSFHREPFTFSCQHNTTITKSLSSFQCGTTVNTLFMPGYQVSSWITIASIKSESQRRLSVAFVSQIENSYVGGSKTRAFSQHRAFTVGLLSLDHDGGKVLVIDSSIPVRSVIFFDAPLTSKVDNSPQIAAYNQHDIIHSN